MYSKKLRILFVGHAKSPIFLRWVQWFFNKGHQIAVASEDDFDNGDIKFYNITYHNKNDKGLFGFIYQAWKIRQAIKDFKPDIIHSHQVKLPGILCLFSGFHPHVTSAWGTDVLLIPQRSFLQKRLIALTLKHADLITAESRHVCNICKQLGGVNVLQVKNGINIGELDKVILNREEYIEKYDLGNFANIIISPRGIIEIYNNDVIIKCIPEVLRYFPKTVFLIKDKYDEFSQMEFSSLNELAGELNIVNNIRFIAKTSYEELLNLYALSDIMVSIPSSDSISVSLIEASYYGAVPIVSNLPANHEVITDNLNGIILNEIAASDLAEAILKLLKAPDLRKKMAELNKEKALTQFSQNNEMSKMEKSYYSLI